MADASIAPTDAQLAAPFLAVFEDGLLDILSMRFYPRTDEVEAAIKDVIHFRFEDNFPLRHLLNHPLPGKPAFATHESDLLERTVWGSYKPMDAPYMSLHPSAAQPLHETCRTHCPVLHKILSDQDIRGPYVAGVCAEFGRLLFPGDLIKARKYALVIAGTPATGKSLLAGLVCSWFWRFEVAVIGGSERDVAASCMDQLAVMSDDAEKSTWSSGGSESDGESEEEDEEPSAAAAAAATSDLEFLTFSKLKALCTHGAIAARRKFQAPLMLQSYRPRLLVHCGVDSRLYRSLRALPDSTRIYVFDREVVERRQLQDELSLESASAFCICLMSYHTFLANSEGF